MPRQTQELPKEFLDWQVALRRHTMLERNGSPHIGVVPMVIARRAGLGIGVVSHSIVCGLLPSPALLDQKTVEFRELYEGGIEEGSRAVYDRGIAYLRSYYQSSDDFDPESVTTLLPEKIPLVETLRVDPRCALVFNVFDTDMPKEVGGVRCYQIDAVAEIHEDGPVYDNVWWHNTIFHGMADDHLVVRFRHEASWDTRFGALSSLST